MMARKCIACKREIPVSGLSWTLAVLSTRANERVGPGCFYCALLYLKRQVNEQHRMPFLSSIAADIWADGEDFKGMIRGFRR